MCFSATRKLLILFMLTIPLVTLSITPTFANKLDVFIHGYPGAHAPLYHGGTYADEAIFTITNFTPYTISFLSEYAPAVDVYTNLGPSYKKDIATNCSAVARINYQHTVMRKCQWDPQFSINDPAGAVQFKLATMPSKARKKPGPSQLPGVDTIFTNIQKVTTDHSNSKGGLGQGVWNIATNLTSNSYYLRVPYFFTK